MESITLAHGQWFYDPDSRLGKPGNFGIVYRGASSEGKVVAVKHITGINSARREVEVADGFIGKDFRHVIPVFDAGQDEDTHSYFVVMACAETSLAKEMQDRSLFQDKEAADILLQIGEGLAEVPHLVHRDLKPGNVLFHDGAWKLADFGIAKVVEEATSENTLKGFLSERYAAPEQWEDKHSSSATDVYALGCIGFELLQGKPPFAGPERADYRVQHLTKEPPALSGHDNRLCLLLSLMLRKPTTRRPTIDHVIAQLTQVARSEAKSSQAPGFESLASASARLAQAEAQEDARANADRLESETRNRKALEGRSVLKNLIDDFFQRLKGSAPSAVIEQKPGGKMMLTLGRAYIEVSFPDQFAVIQANAFSKSKWDVLTGAQILVVQQKPIFGWGSSLWYARLPSDADLTWYEVGYMEKPPNSHPKFIQDRIVLRGPLPMDNISPADEAAAGGIGSYQLAFRPKRIDDKDPSTFFNQWAELLAKAVQGELRQPKLPLD